MIKRNLFKAVMLGLCMAALSSSGTAFAMAGAGTTGSVGAEVITPELEALYAKQSDIDKLLFEDHAKDIEKKGFMVNTTGVINDVIEIGISPFNEENADYIYELVGKDEVKVVEFDQSIIYANSAPLVAPDENTASDPDAAVTSTDAEAEDGKMEIQIESVAGGTAGDKVETVSAPVDDVRTLASANGESAEEKDNASAPVMVLAIAGGAVLVGGAVLYSGRRKANK